MPAHILGWWGKTLMLRDPSMLWVISIGFELMEVTFRHWLPNFNECWWDSWILDFLICNNLGIWLGMFGGRRGRGSVRRLELLGLRATLISASKSAEPTVQSPPLFTRRHEDDQVV